MKTLTKTLLAVGLLALATTAVATPASAEDEYGFCVYSYYSIPPSTCAACVRTPNLPGEHRCGYVIVE